MPVADPHSRREFLATAGAAAVASTVPAWAAADGSKRRYALVGTGIRGARMWGRDIVQPYGDVVEFVGLCDVNPLRVEAGKQVHRRQLSRPSRASTRCWRRPSPTC